MGSSNSKYCDKCKKQVCLHFLHCDKCKKCKCKYYHKHCDKCDIYTDIAGQFYNHCDKCKKCSDRDYIHCDKCNSCHHANAKHCIKCNKCFLDYSSHTKTICDVEIKPSAPNFTTFLKNKNNIECSICLEPMHKGFTKQTDCGHKFHVECLEKYTQKTCPLCRATMFSN